MHSRETTNYKLPVFIGSDTPKMVDWNEAMEKIDYIGAGGSQEIQEQIDAINEKIGTTEITGTITENIRDNKSDIEILDNQVDAVRNELDLQQTQVNTLAMQVENYGEKVTTNTMLINSLQNSKQEKLIAGDNIEIASNNTIKVVGINDRLQECEENIENHSNQLNAINNKLTMVDEVGSPLNIPLEQVLIVDAVPTFRQADKGKIFLVAEEV